jgi:hypothetical protein
VSDTADEVAHDYVSPGAQSVDTLTTRYEWGVDSIPAPGGGTSVVYPATIDTGRHTTGTSELTLAIRPDNLGVMLRRKLDYGYPDQRAEVYVADAESNPPAFVHAGTWYLAGSNQCVFSDPPGELDPFQPVMETSNRRWRDDEFLVPRVLTQGRRALRVRLVPSATWSEYRYTAYVWTLPPAP